jgi:hypothetical protein
MGKDWGLSELLLLEEHWEWETPGILGVNLLHLDSTIGEEVVQNVVLVTTIIGSVLPKDVEAENFSVVVEETLEGLVGSATLEKHLNVVLHFSLIWGSLLVVDHQSGLGEEILWVAFWVVEWNTLVGVEPSGEIIAVDDSEDSCVHIEVHTNVEVLPNVVLGWVLWVWQLVSLHEDSLWDTGVLNSWLEDVDGVVIEIVENDALSQSVVLIGVFNDWFLEVSRKGEGLSVILEPLRGDLGDGVLDLILSTTLATSELGWDSMGHGHN